MKKTLANYMIVSIINTINDQDGFWCNPQKRNKLKVSMPVRSALKRNLSVLDELGKSYMVAYNEITSELEDLFVQENKARRNTDGKFELSAEYKKEYEEQCNIHLSKLLKEEHNVDLCTYSYKAFEKYGDLNGELLTEAEMDILELFVDYDNNAEND